MVDARRALDTSVAGFLAELASAAPMPGGGSAAALAGSLAAALTAMVCRVTAARDPSAAALAETGTTAEGLGRRLSALADADVEAYQALLAARRLPADTRAAAADAALRRATEIPLDVVIACRDVLALCEQVAGSARASTLADLEVAVAIARGALEGGAATVRANLRESANGALAQEAGERVGALVAESQARVGRTAQAIAARVGRVG
jgi:formiminotetrahydrofolate cyclodeaminase